MTLKVRVSNVASRYAEALFELAKNESCHSQVESDLRCLYSVLKLSIDFQRLITSPIFSQAQQAIGLATLSKMIALSPLTQNFLKLLLTKRRLSILPSVIPFWISKLSKYHGKILVEVVIAKQLARAQRIALETAIITIAGKQPQITIRIDPALLGGLSIRIGSRVIDSSLHTKLQRLQISMKGVG